MNHSRPATNPVLRCHSRHQAHQSLGCLFGTTGTTRTSTVWKFETTGWIQNHTKPANVGPAIPANAVCLRLEVDAMSTCALRDGEVARWVRLKRQRKILSPPRSAAKGSLPYILDIWWLLLPCKNPKNDVVTSHCHALFDHFLLRGDGNHYTDRSAAWSCMTEKCHLCGQPWLGSKRCYVFLHVVSCPGTTEIAYQN